MSKKNKNNTCVTLIGFVRGVNVEVVSDNSRTATKEFNRAMKGLTITPADNVTFSDDPALTITGTCDCNCTSEPVTGTFDISGPGDDF